VWFDSHCHLDFAAFDRDRLALWQQAREHGIEALFIPGVSATSWDNVARVSRSLPGTCFGLGLHPAFLSEASEAEWQAALLRLPHEYERLGAVAIGECGLDRRRDQRGGLPLERQLPVLEQHLVVAVELEAPLVLHVVGAHGAALDLLERFGPFPAGGVLHSYSGTAELVPRYVRLNLSFGYSATVCRESAHKAHRALRATPLDRLLLETDAPDRLPPSAHVAGRSRAEPRDLLLVAEAVARLSGLELHALASATTQNATALFTGRRPIASNATAR
jgi:TatD DNase family protein